MFEKATKLNVISIRPKVSFFLLALISALAFNMELYTADPEEAYIHNRFFLFLYKLNSQIASSVSGKGTIIVAMTVLFFFAFLYFFKINPLTKIKGDIALSLFFSVMYTGGRAFSYNDSLSSLISPRFNILKTMILVIGFAAFYLLLIRLLYTMIHSFKDISPKWTILHVYNKHPFLSVYLVILLMWSIHLIMRYPGAMSYDNWRQLAYYMGYDTYTTAQPIFHTWLFGTFIRFGLITGSSNIGLFLFILFQSFFMAAVLAYTLLIMTSWHTPRWLRLLTLCIYCIAPYFAGYAAFPIKDYLFVAGLLLWTIEIICLLQKKNKSWFINKSGADSRTTFSTGNNSGIQHVFFWIIGAALMILCRKNGIYIYILTSFFIMLLFLRQIRKTPQAVILSIIVLTIPVVLTSSINAAITDHYNVVQDSPKEMFSLPFQQTARFVRDYGDEISDDDKEIISKVLDYDNLPELYSEMTADPVKTTYHAQSNKELLDYFSVWLKEFLMHPLCYVEATWNQNYYIFMPDIDNIVYNQDCYFGSATYQDIDFDKYIGFYIPPALEGASHTICSWYKMLNELPIIGRLNNVAFYIMLMFTVLLFTKHDYKKMNREYLIVFMPCMISFIFILLAPLIQNQPRYAFPIIYSMPLLMAYNINTCKKANTKCSANHMSEKDK